MKGLSILLVISLLLSLAGCNFPLTRENRQLAQQSLTALSEDGGATAPAALPGQASLF